MKKFSPAKLIKYGSMAAFILCALVLCVESLIPGAASGKHSDKFGSLIDIPVDKVVEPTSMELTAADGTLSELVYVGQSISLLPVFAPQNTTYKHVSWQISDEKLAKIDENGVITFLNEGSVSATALSDYDSSITASVGFEIGRIMCETISVNAPKQMSVGQKAVISATVMPKNASDKRFALSTSSDCVRLDGHTLTAVSAGTATITATTLDGGASASVTVEVTEVAAQSLCFVKDGSSVDRLTVNVGERALLSVSLLPENVTHTQIIWHSDVDLFFVSGEEFYVTPHSPGEFDITVESNGLSASLHVSALGKQMPSDVTHIVAKPMELTVGQVSSVDLTMLCGTELAWQTPTLSASSNVVTIDELGAVHAEREGTATIEISVGAIRTSVDVIVTQARVTELTLNRPNSEPEIGKEYQLFCTHVPKTAVPEPIEWSVSDEKIATVKDGVCTFVKAGTVVVTAKCGDVTSSIELSASNVLSCLGIKSSGFDSFIGGENNRWSASLKLNSGARIALIFGENATFREYELSSSNGDVLNIDDNIITATGLGSATITVTYWDGLAPDKTVYTIDVGVVEQKLSDVTQNWSKTVRKGIGHFGAFLVTGIFASLTFALFIRRKYLALPPALLAGFGLAGLTELLQAITPGRGPSFADVLLDFEGFCFAALPILLVFIIVYFARKLSSRNK